MMMKPHLGESLKSTANKVAIKHIMCATGVCL